MPRRGRARHYVGTRRGMRRDAILEVSEAFPREHVGDGNPKKVQRSTGQPSLLEKMQVSWVDGRGEAWKKIYYTIINYYINVRARTLLN